MFYWRSKNWEVNPPHFHRILAQSICSVEIRQTLKCKMLLWQIHWAKANLHCLYGTLVGDQNDLGTLSIYGLVIEDNASIHYIPKYNVLMAKKLTPWSSAVLYNAF